MANRANVSNLAKRITEVQPMSTQNLRDLNCLSSQVDEDRITAQGSITVFLTRILDQSWNQLERTMLQKQASPAHDVAVR